MILIVLLTPLAFLQTTFIQLQLRTKMHRKNHRSIKQLISKNPEAVDNKPNNGDKKKTDELEDENESDDVYIKSQGSQVRFKQIENNNFPE